VITTRHHYRLLNPKKIYFTSITLPTDQPPYDLSGKPKSTPNGGYTNRCSLPSCVSLLE
jgi:hypothetical protein